MRSYTGFVQAKTSVAVTMWLVDKTEMQQLPVSVLQNPKRNIDPSSIPEWPAGYDKKSWWLLSSRVDRSELPDLGVFTLESSSSSIRQLPMDAAPTIGNTESASSICDTQSAGPGAEPNSLKEAPLNSGSQQSKAKKACKGRSKGSVY